MKLRCVLISVAFLVFAFAVNGEENDETREVSNDDAEGVEVECRPHDMVIILPKSLLYGLDREHLRLIDVNCKAQENLTHYTLTTAHTECGTILKHTHDSVVYSNMVSEIPIEQHQIVTRVREAMIPFHCFYSKWGVVSSIGLKPTSKKVIFSSEGNGTFTITLDLFNDDSYGDAFSQDDFPAQFNIRERMYFEARVDTEDDRLRILALDCFASPSQDRNSQPRYDVIQDGCSVDDTLEFHSAPDAESQRFSLEAFQFVSQHPFVFFHCSVQICNVTDPNSRCARGCEARKRRSVDQPASETMDDIYSLAQGPLTLNRGEAEPQEDEPVEVHENIAKRGFNVPVVAALAVVIGLCVVGMSFLGWQRKREKAMRQFIPLYEDVQK